MLRGAQTMMLLFFLLVFVFLCVCACGCVYVVYITCDMYVQRRSMPAMIWNACSETDRERDRDNDIGIFVGISLLGTYDVYSGVLDNRAGTCSPCCPDRSLRGCTYRWIAVSVRFHNDRRAAH